MHFDLFDPFQESLRASGVMPRTKFVLSSQNGDQFETVR